MYFMICYLLHKVFCNLLSVSVLKSVAYNTRCFVICHLLNIFVIHNLLYQVFCNLLSVGVLKSVVCNTRCFVICHLLYIFSIHNLLYQVFSNLLHFYYTSVLLENIQPFPWKFIRSRTMTLFNSPEIRM